MKGMGLTSAQVKKAIAIVRQYAVLYGGGISSGDAAVREELDKITQGLEEMLPKAERDKVAEAESWKTLAIVKRAAAPAVKRGSRARRDAGSIVASPPRRVHEEDIKVPASAKAGHGSEKIKRDSSRAASAKAAPQAKAVEPTRPKAEEHPKAKPLSAPEPPTRAQGAALAHTPTPTSAHSRAHDQEHQAEVAAKAANRAAELRNRKEDQEVGARIAERLGSRGATPSKAATRNAAQKLSGNAVSPEPAEAAAKAQNSQAKPQHRVEAMHLFDAYNRNMLPKYGGYIVNSFYKAEDHYSIFEIVGYEDLKDIYPTGNSLVFKTAGCKLYAIAEQANYSFKSVEPVSRSRDYAIPYRFSELDSFVTKRYQTVYVAKKPILSPTSFSIVKPTGDDFSVLFYDVSRVFENMQDFMISVLHERNAIPLTDARKATEAMLRGIRSFGAWFENGA
jgi:hypothetical protein